VRPRRPRRTAGACRALGAREAVSDGCWRDGDAPRTLDEMPDAKERAAAALIDLDGFGTPAAAGTLAAVLDDDEVVECASLLADGPAAAAIVTDRRLVVLVGDP